MQILRAILKKKVYPQSSSPSLAAKKYLDNSNKPKSTNYENEIFEKTDDGSKWVKTDSECKLSFFMQKSITFFPWKKTKIRLVKVVLTRNLIMVIAFPGCRYRFRDIIELVPLRPPLKFNTR